MKADFQPERLMEVRRQLGINRAEAARRMNTSPMTYGRYEHGERIPSPQVLEVMAQALDTSPDYLTGKTDDPSPEYVIFRRSDDAWLYEFARQLKQCDPTTQERLRFYMDKLRELSRSRREE